MTSVIINFEKDFPVEYRHLLENYEQEKYHNTVMALASKMSNSESIELAGKLVIAEVVRAAGPFKMYLKNAANRLSSGILQFMKDHVDELSELIDTNVSLNYLDHDFFSASTLTKTYLLRPIYGEAPVESPLQMYLRVAVQLYKDEGIERVKRCFYEMAHHYYTPASPTLFNAGTKQSQGSSCFLVSIGDSLESILGTGVRDAGMISRAKGGLGIGLGQLRHSGIGDDGMASGVAPVARILDKLVTYVDQGGSRTGAGTAFLPIWHIDIKEFVNATNNYSQSHALRLAHLNTSVWMHDLFLKRVSEGGKWTVFCPAKAKLHGLYGEEFEKEYVRYEKLAIERDEIFAAASKAYTEAKALYLKDPSNEEYGNKVVETLEAKRLANRNRIDNKVYEAREIMDLIVNLEIKSGFPFVMYGDAVNMKTNQANIGKINSSNLCVSGDTPILTREYGYVQIKQLAECENADGTFGKDVEVWNGAQWSLVRPKKTSDSSELMTVYLNNGASLVCTAYHKFSVLPSKNASPVFKEASLLREGDLLEECEFSVTPGNASNDFSDAYSIGMKLVGGTGCFTSPHHDFKADTHTLEVWEKKIWDFMNTSVMCRVEFVSGMFDSNWSLGSFVCFSYKMAKTLQLLLTTLGVKTCVSLHSSPLSSEKKFAVTFSKNSISQLLSLGMRLREFKDINASLSHINGEFESLRVEKVVYTHEMYPRRVEATYCFTEPLRNRGVFAGILTGQCQEICEVSTPETVASCNLSSISLKAFVKSSFGTVDDSSSTPTPTAAMSHESIVTLFNRDGHYDFKKLGEITQSVVENLDSLIESNYYPVPEKTEKLNKSTRPLGIGVSGLDDAVKLLDLMFESHEAEALNKGVFACMYFNALVSSLRLSIQKGEYNDFRTGSFTLPRAKYEQEHFSSRATSSIPDSENNNLLHETFCGSPLSNGFFQFDLWTRRAGVLAAKGYLDAPIYNRADDTPIDPRSWGQETVRISVPAKSSWTNPFGHAKEEVTIEPTWDSLRNAIMKYGVRNSLLLTIMPTASTAQVLRNAESTEVHASNIYTRTVRTGHFVVANQHLVKDLEKIGLWNENTLQYLVAFGGSLKHFEGFVQDHSSFFPLWEADKNLNTLKRLVQKYKTMFEISQKTILKMARQRGIYVDQSQSTNIYLTDPSLAQVKAVHSYGWKLGLKTGLYYLRQKNAAEGATFSLSSSMLAYREKVASSSAVAAGPTSTAAKSPTPTKPVVSNITPHVSVAAVRSVEEAPACTLEKRMSGDCLECGS